ncbi:MAG: hypothetical protein M3Q72_02365 [Actinomycetota bacterium]|nr:hypothetical protein [Actinomycetota bacterium]
MALSVLAATLVVAAGTGCSADDDGGTEAASTTTTAAQTIASTTSASRPEPPEDQSRWAKQVDIACKPWQGRIDAVPPPADASGLEPWLAETVPLVRKLVAAVRAVKPPAKQSEAKRAALFVSAMGKLERGLSRYLAALRAGDAVAIKQAVTEANAAGAASRGYAVPLDITECGGYEGR